MIRFAGFIITYNRPEILALTISKVLDQTFPPEKLWIIDNSENDLTEKLINNLNLPELIYYKVGYNAGPAKAVNIAFSLIPTKEFDWIYWGDDDDPPPFQDTFERLFDFIENFPDQAILGQVGIVGHRFDFTKGVMNNVMADELLGTEAIQVHSIAGGQCKIINTSVIERGPKIAEELFFGFEELDFDIQLHKLGFESWVPADLFLIQKNTPGRDKLVETRLLSKNTLWRQYYSTRNLCRIYQKHTMYFAVFYLFFRKSFKLVWDFRKGPAYGLASAKYNLLGIWHWIINRYGKTI